MEPDITNREEEADPVASNAMDEKGDSNPFGWSPLEGVVMKTCDMASYPKCIIMQCRCMKHNDY